MEHMGLGKFVFFLNQLVIEMLSPQKATYSTNELKCRTSTSMPNESKWKFFEFLQHF